MGEGQLVSYPLYTQLPASISTQTPKKPSLILFSSNDPSNACLRKTHQLYLKKKISWYFPFPLFLFGNPWYLPSITPVQVTVVSQYPTCLPFLLPPAVYPLYRVIFLRMYQIKLFFLLKTSQLLPIIINIKCPQGLPGLPCALLPDLFSFYPAPLPLCHTDSRLTFVLWGHQTPFHSKDLVLRAPTASLCLCRALSWVLRWQLKYHLPP